MSKKIKIIVDHDGAVVGVEHLPAGANAHVVDEFGRASGGPNGSEFSGPDKFATKKDVQLARDVVRLTASVYEAVELLLSYINDVDTGDIEQGTRLGLMDDLCDELEELGAIGVSFDDMRLAIPVLEHVWAEHRQCALEATDTDEEEEELADRLPVELNELFESAK